MLYRVLVFCLFFTSLFGTEHVHLKTPDISRKNIIGTNVGIRPYRKSGVRIEAETIEDKIIIHNYGYGSSGLSIAFGGAKEVLNILDRFNQTPKIVAIMGAGVVGMATAFDLLKNGYEVHIYADEWSPNLTSNVAAGIWTPISAKDLPEDQKMLHLRLNDNSKLRLLKSTGDLPEFAGIRLMCSYGFKTQNSEQSGNVNPKEEIIAHFDNGVIRNGRRIYLLGFDGKLFMEDLYLKIKENGALFKSHHFDSFDDVLCLEEPIIINCTSMGSAALFNDQEFLPVRGQLVYFQPQEKLDYLYFHNVDNDPNDSSSYYIIIYPWSDRVILGGVYEHDKNEPTVELEVIDKMIENAERALSGNL